MYRINVDVRDMTKIETVTLTNEELAERYDLQEWIDKHPECLGEELLIIQKEFSAWDNQSRKRLDLLALDKDGNLVIIENKRDDSPYDVVAQAITYASFCSTMSVRRIVEEYSRYLPEETVENNVNAAEDDICRFLELDELNDGAINKKQRILVVAGNYPIEVTSAAMWLRNNCALDIGCVRYQLYRDGENLYIDFDRIIPIPDVEDFQVRLEERRVEDNASASVAHRCIPDYRDYWNLVNQYLSDNPELMQNGLCVNENWARRGEQWFDFKFHGVPYHFSLKLYNKSTEVGLALAINTGTAEGMDFYGRISADDFRARINEAFGGVDVVWRDRETKTMSAKNTWNRENPLESIQWQINTLLHIKNVVDELLNG